MSANAFDLTGRTAVVTGANTGIGQGIAVALAQAGADVVLVARRDPSETRRLVEDAGQRAHVVMADLSSIEPCERIVAETVETFGQLDILVNNAGIIRRNDALDFSEEDWDAVMDVNLKVLFFLSQAVARHMTGWASQDGADVLHEEEIGNHSANRVPFFAAGHAMNFHGFVDALTVTASIARVFSIWGVLVSPL